MAFKIPLVGTKSLSKGYFEGLPNFVWGDVKDKDEIGKKVLGPSWKEVTFLMKSCCCQAIFGEGDSQMRNIAKEAKMPKSFCHSNITQFIGVCSKPLAIMTSASILFPSAWTIKYQICKSFCTPLIASRIKLKPLNISCPCFRRLQRTSRQVYFPAFKQCRASWLKTRQRAGQQPTLHWHQRGSTAKCLCRLSCNLQINWLRPE